jgi:hypothetical protein
VTSFELNLSWSLPFHPIIGIRPTTNPSNKRKYNTKAANILTTPIPRPVKIKRNNNTIIWAVELETVSGHHGEI